MTLTEFLLARIAEDEAAQHSGMSERYGSPYQWHRLDCGLNSMNTDPCDCEIPTRVLAECEAKRRIVEDYAILNGDYRVTRSPETEARRFQALVSVGQLAIVYADHPDYDETWRP